MGAVGMLALPARPVDASGMSLDMVIAFCVAWTGNVALWIAAIRLRRKRRRAARALEALAIWEAEQMGRYR